MPLTRRQILAGAFKGAAATAVVGSGALGWRIYNTELIGDHTASFDPWLTFETSAAGTPMSLVAAAILAASPHNTQPWKFELGPDHIDLYADEGRHLGSFDPYRREMWLGLGCAVENMVQAAGAKGFLVESVVAAPGDRSRGDLTAKHAARVILRPSETKRSRLAEAIAERRTNRAEYLQDKPIAPEMLAALYALPSRETTRLMLFPAAEDKGRAFARSTIAATQAIADDTAMSLDSLRWFRSNPCEVALHRDGLSIPAAGLAPWLSIVGQIMPAPDARQADDYWIASTRRQVDSAPWFGMLLVRDLYDRRQQIEAGRLWQRTQLELTLAGLASQPLNQMIEVVDRERELDRADATARHLATWSGEGWHPTFAFRFGYALRKAPHSARRSKTVVVAT